MDAANNIATDLFYKIRSRFQGLKLGADTGQITINPESARFFDFDYTENNNAIGHVSISLAEPNSMKVYFSTGITEGMDDGQKDNWYKFLRELRSFAKRRLLAFDTRDIAKDNLDKRDYAFLSQHAKPNAEEQKFTNPVGESVMNESNLYGTKTMSYQKLEDTRLIIKHSKAVMDDMAPGARSRNISALFVENQDGERFKYPFVHLAGARAMQRHVANGGLPYDAVGESIIKMSEEIAQLKSFSNYVVRNDLMNSDTNEVVSRSSQKLESLRNQIHKLAKQGHYESYVESFQAMDQAEVPNDVMEEFKEKFTVKSFNEEMSDVFPLLYRLMQEETTTTLGYDDIVGLTNEADEQEVENYKDPFAAFEAWAMGLGEDSPLQSDDVEEQQTAMKSLQALIGEPFPAGVDGTNAIESLKGIIEDPQVLKDIKNKAKDDPNHDIRPVVRAWVEENAPELLDELDFGDMATDEPAAEPDEIEPPTEGVEEQGEMNTQKLAEFIFSFYDRNSGTFPKGPEGVCTMVGKKFGEQAEAVARKMVERMAPVQDQGAEYVEASAQHENNAKPFDPKDSSTWGTEGEDWVSPKDTETDDSGDVEPEDSWRPRMKDTTASEDVELARLKSLIKF